MSEQDDLMAEAFAHLEAGDPESALEIGKRLESMQYSGPMRCRQWPTPIWTTWNRP
ncbi:hypothetical protein [Pandoraea sp. XY-2]|uniref:hypothetical protein n=1 Tax=Pandoraea sp. XY-2 TaxID=2518599 RepID=UPI0013EE7067|nr:hypothetical protein [Pandoraea sp. XY-2]